MDLQGHGLSWMVSTWSAPRIVKILIRWLRGRSSTSLPPSSFRVLAAPVKIDVVIELKVDNAIMAERVAQRVKETIAAGGKPRPDDNPETLKKRLDVYGQNTAPLLDYYGKQGKVVTIDGMAPIADVTAAIAGALDKHR